MIVGYSIVHLLILVIVVAACVVTIAWIVLAAFVGIFAIRLLMSM